MYLINEAIRKRVKKRTMVDALDVRFYVVVIWIKVLKELRLDVRQAKPRMVSDDPPK